MPAQRHAILVSVGLGLFACATAIDTLEPADPKSTGGGSAFGGTTTKGGTKGTAGSPSPGGGGVNNTAGKAGANGTQGEGGESAGGESAGGEGTVGVGGSAGHAGTGGTGGAGGTGGTGVVIEPGSCAVSPTMSLTYKQDNATSQIVAQVEFFNETGTPIALNQLKFRYFFSNEESSALTINVYDAKLDSPYSGHTGQATKAITQLTPALNGADHYLELGIDSATTIAMGSTGFISFAVQPADYNGANLNQANDFSFNAAYSVMTAWDHIAIYQGNTLVFGCIPAAL